MGYQELECGRYFTIMNASRAAKRSIVLSLCRCPIHGVMSVSIDNVSAGVGIRITPSKCCGRWDEVTKWKMSAGDLKSAAEEFLRAAEDLENAEA